MGNTSIPHIDKNNSAVLTHHNSVASPSQNSSQNIFEILNEIDEEEDKNENNSYAIEDVYFLYKNSNKTLNSNFIKYRNTSYYSVKIPLYILIEVFRL